MDLNIVYIKNVGIFFCQITIVEKEIRDLYKNEEYSTNKELYTDPVLFQKRVEQIAMPKVKWICSCISLQSSNQWMDIGSATGEILEALKQSGIFAVGLEADQTECEFANARGLTTYNKYVDTTVLKEHVKNVNVISAFNVIEYIPDVAAFVRMIGNFVPTGTFLLWKYPVIRLLAC